MELNPEYWRLQEIRAIANENEAAKRRAFVYIEMKKKEKKNDDG